MKPDTKTYLRTRFNAIDRRLDDINAALGDLPSDASEALSPPFLLTPPRAAPSHDGTCEQRAHYYTKPGQGRTHAQLEAATTYATLALIGLVLTLCGAVLGAWLW